MDKIIVVIPGNPGVANFYDNFAEKLFSTSKIPTLVVGYLSHSFNNKSNNLYSIHQQLEHKEQFIKFLIEKYPKISIYLVGHSIGGWICLELLNRNIDNIKQIFGLFPTISYLNISDNGQNLFIKYGVKKGVRNVLASIVHIISFLPFSIRFMIGEAIKMWDNNNDSLLKPFVVHGLFNYQMIINLCYMAETEFSNIREANYQIIDENQSKIQFYYAENDEWIPNGFNQIMKKKYPKIVTIDQFETKHAFILSRKGIKRIVEFINLNLK